MRTAHIESKYDYIFELFESVSEDHQELISRLFSEDSSNEHAFTRLLRKNLSTKNEQLSTSWAYQKIIDAIGEYIRVYHAPASTKQQLYRVLYALCETLGARNSIPAYAEYLKELPLPVTEDITVALIKELHNRDGITKDEFAKKHNVDARTVQNKLQALSGNKKYKPVRIAGYAVHVPVKTVHPTRKRAEDQLYYTPNTMNPLVMQMNTTQVASLLQSLFYSNQKGNIIPLDMAIDVWCQLSEYTKKRIRDVFCKNDPDFSSFIDEVDEESSSLSYKYMTESDMLNQRDLSPREQLALAEKGMICDIVLVSPQRTRRRQKIVYDVDRKCYFAVPADDPHGKKLRFKLEEFLYLTKSE